jgi:hypothetical protein
MKNETLAGNSPKSPAANWIAPIGFIVLGAGLGAAGIYVGETDDAPGAALLGLVLMIGLVVFGVRKALRRRR